MSELGLTLARLAFLGLLWLFVLAAVLVLGLAITVTVLEPPKSAKQARFSSRTGPEISPKMQPEPATAQF